MPWTGRRARALLAALCASLAASGCDDDAPAPEADPCADVPLVNWANFGQGFLIEQCQGCHASTTPDRHDAPPSITFDTVDDAWAHAERILARAAAEPPTMPPVGGTEEDDRTRLRWWLECAEEGT